MSASGQSLRISSPQALLCVAVIVVSFALNYGDDEGEEPNAVQEWLDRIQRKGASRFKLPFRATTIPLTSASSRDYYDTYSGVAAQWEPPYQTHQAHQAHVHDHHQHHHPPHYHHHQRPYVVPGPIQYIPIPIHHPVSKKSDHHYLWPILLIGVFFLPLLLGALLVPITFSFITSILQLINLIQQYKMSTWVMASNNQTAGRRRKRRDALYPVKDSPFIIDRVISFARTLETSLAKFGFNL